MKAVMYLLLGLFLGCLGGSLSLLVGLCVLMNDPAMSRDLYVGLVLLGVAGIGTSCGLALGRFG